MTRMVARSISVTASLVLLVGLLNMAGCDSSALEEAEQEARKAKATVSALELSIAQSEQKISDLKEELSIVRETRDELQSQSDQIVEERDQALLLAQQAEQVITELTTRASGQNSAAEALRKEIVGLKRLVGEQAALIEELQKGAAQAAIEEATTEEPPPVVDPNSGDL